MKGQLDQTIALVLAAHGDRGGDAPNERLFAHADVLSERHDFACVATGVLNGEPALEDALAQADACGAKQIVIYPMFMSAGYFVKTVLADRVAAAALKTPAGIMQPLGLDKRLALLMLENSLRATKSANLEPAGARLLIVGHGSRDGTENAEATRRAARLLSPHSPFARVETAFIEETPFVADALRNYDGTSVVAGFLTGEGLHAGEDVPEIIRESGARALYTGPIGGHPRVPELIASSIHDALSDKEEGENENENTDEDEKAAVPAQAEVEPAAGPAARADVGYVTAAAATGVREEPHEKPRRAGRGGGPVRFMMKAAVALVLIAVLVIGVVPFLVPEDVVRNRVASVVKQQTGRDLAVRGGTSFSVFPNVGVELEDVSVSNPPGMAKGEMLRMDSLNLNLKLLPLLTRRVEVDRFVLVRPVFNLLVDSQGRKNWDLNKTAALEGPRGTDVALHASTVKSSAALAQAGGSGSSVQDISLGTVKITDGTLNYSDERAGTRRRVQAINVTFVQPQLSEPLDAEGDLVWNGEKLSFDGRVKQVSALLRDEATEAKVSLSSRHGQGSFDGKVSLAPSFSAEGAVNAETKSLRALAGWLGDPLPPGGGLGPLSIVGNLGVQGETITFSKAKLGIDGMTGEGRVIVRLKGVRPHITASLALDKLDLNPYLEGTSAVAPSAVPAAPAQPGTQDEPAAAPEQGQSLTDFIEKLNKGGSAPAQPQVRAWSQHAMDFTELRAADADVEITANAIHFRKVRTGRSDITAAVKSGVLTADLTRFELYSGTGSGRVTLNGARATPGITALFNLSNISALPLLRDFADFNWVSGRANMALSVSGNGRSQSEIMHSLQGQGSFAFGDGAIEGFNIPAMVRGLKQGKFDGWKRNEREKTDFSQLAASFVINQGVANNKDLNLVGPLVRMTGEGDIDLGREQIDYSALPRLVASLEGQGAQIEQGRGIAVPIKIVGSWERPKLTVDLERLMNDPELAQNAIDEVGRALENVKNKDDLNKVLQGIFGGGNQQGANGGQQGEGGQAKPGGLLKRFLQ